MSQIYSSRGNRDVIATRYAHRMSEDPLTGVVLPRCFSFVIVCVLAVLVVSPDPARGAETTALSASPSPATLKDHSATITILTGTAATLPVGLEMVDGDGTPVAGATATSPKGGTLAPGATFATTVTEPTVPTVPTRLVIVAGAVRGLPLRAVVRVTLQPPTPVPPAVSEWTFRDADPSGGGSGKDLPLDGRCDRLSFQEVTVQADGIAVKVTAGCPPGDGTAHKLRLEAKSPPRGHSYKGKLQIGDNVVELTVDATWP